MNIDKSIKIYLQLYPYWTIFKLFYWYLILILNIIFATRILWINPYPMDLVQLYVWILIYSAGFSIVDRRINQDYYDVINGYFKHWSDGYLR